MRQNIAICFFLFAIFGCGTGSHQKSGGVKKVLCTNVVTNPETLDPRKARDMADINIILQLQEGLFHLEEGGSLKPALSEKYEVSSDRKTFTFHLRDAKWSNGEPIRAKDFVYSYKTTLSPGFSSNNTALLFPIKNAKKIKMGLLPSYLLGIKEIDDVSFSIELEEPVPYFLKLLASPVYFPIYHGIDKQNEKWATRTSSYISSGPFVLQNWIHDNLIELEKNPFYWDKDHVALEQLHFIMVDEDTEWKMFENGDMDLIGSPFSYIPLAVLEDLKKRNKLETKDVLEVRFLRINTNLPRLDQPDFRLLLASAFSREELVQQICLANQKPAYSFVPKKENKPFSFIEKITNESLLEGPLYLTYFMNERNNLIAQTLQEAWKKKLGLDVRLEPLEGKSYYDRVAKQDFQLVLSSWVADYDDPSSFLEIFKSKGTGNNNTGWENKTYTELLDRSNRELPEERIEIFRAAEEILLKEMPVIPLFFGTRDRKSVV